MNRALQIINLLGIAALAALCAAQWKANSRLDLHVRDLDKTLLEQLDKIAEQDKSLRANAADLNEFRERVAQLDASLKETQIKLASATARADQSESQIKQLVLQRDALKAALDKWMAAVAQRDVAIRQAGQTVQKLAAERNDAVTRFNELAGRYNALVKDLNARTGK